MIYANYKDWNRARQNAFNHAARQYGIQCARHVMNLAPLPEFKHAVDVLEWFDESGSPQSRVALKKLYRDLFAGKKWNHHKYGYTAVGEIFLGIHTLVYDALHPKGACGSWYCQRFTEACYLAGHAIQLIRRCKCNEWPQQTQSAEYDWQNVLFRKLFDAYEAEFGGTWGLQQWRQKQESKALEVKF